LDTALSVCVWGCLAGELRLAGTSVESQPLPDDERRRLETERLAATGWQHQEAVATLQYSVHCLALKWSELGKAPDPVERVEQIGVVRTDYEALG
jgi:hypothetical protein